MIAQKIVQRLLEADEPFDARAYLEKTPEEVFDEGAVFILRAARQLYADMRRDGIIKIASERRKGALFDPDESAAVQAVIQLALEREAGPATRRAYLRIKRYGQSRYF